MKNNYNKKSGFFKKKNLVVNWIQDKTSADILVQEYVEHIHDSISKVVHFTENLQLGSLSPFQIEEAVFTTQ